MVVSNVANELLFFLVCVKGPHDSEADDSEKRAESKPKVAFDSDRKELVEAEPDVMDNPNGLASQNGLDVDVKDFRCLHITQIQSHIAHMTWFPKPLTIVRMTLSHRQCSYLQF